MLYQWFEMSHAAVRPVRFAAHACQSLLTNPLNPLAHWHVNRHAAAACEVFERTTRRYAKPEFGLTETIIDGQSVAVAETVVWQRPFCRLLNFKRDLPTGQRDQDPKILLVAPMSGHFATLLRGTVQALLPNYDVYITDWEDARDVSILEGRFDLDDYIEYVREILTYLRGDVHVFAVCQPAVPVLAAISTMEQDNDPNVPWSVILAGGPIDTRINPTAVNKLADQRSIAWFESNVITHVPWPLPGAGRPVYPGFLQLSGFMSMNLDRHANAHHDFFEHLVDGDGDSAEKHREFYDEYLAVMDLTADFYLQTIDTVFIQHALPKGEMRHRGSKVRPEAIQRVALMTIEGEKDDITGLGQCAAAHDICTSVPQSARFHFEAPGVGHYGIFNGSRFRSMIVPRINQFVQCHDPRGDQSSCALLRKFKPGQSLRHTALEAQAAANDDPRSSAAAAGPSDTGGDAFSQQNSPVVAALRLWEMSNKTMIKTAWRMWGA